MNQKHDIPYLNLVSKILDNGYTKKNRTGVETIGIFGHQMRFDLSDNTIPLLTTKQVHTRSIIHELIWFLQGSSNIKYLTDNKVTIWDEWADENGDLGPIYGPQWRDWDGIPRLKDEDDITIQYGIEGIDQIKMIMELLKNNPDSRRIVVSAWNPRYIADERISPQENVKLGNMALSPCHCLFQFNTRPATIKELDEEAVRRGQEMYDMDNASVFGHYTSYFSALGIPLIKLDCQLYQRSCDVGLGVPFNIAQYSMLLRMVAHITNMLPGDFIWTGGDVHIYKNHITGLKEQLDRHPMESPKLYFTRSVENIDDFVYNDFNLVDYKHYPPIKFNVAV